MSFPPNSPTFVSKNEFLEYLDTYVFHFDVNPLYQRVVESAFFDNVDGKWHIKAMNVERNIVENYVVRFLVVATGENSEGFVPRIEGLNEFGGKIMHSIEYGNGKSFKKKDVLVVGCGNSGMEIAYDLANWGAQTSIVARSSDDGAIFDENGMPKKRSSCHWKGEKGIYCVGFASAGLFGISSDAKNISEDINRILMHVDNKMNEISSSSN
ncbi:hypothetical protein HAX54_005647 [Datura stramonium]|uniref:Flavin-containing monooxygenase n=1 Tax=Datura stramonium TaxID=4076 RepID=A0ABS8TAR3_DATST|nr:hypothetical protein [Datura stramonium]